MEISERRSNLAREIIDYSKNFLAIKLRFIRNTLSVLKLVEVTDDLISTDGKYLFYDPKTVINFFKKRSEFSSCYLHVYLHCIFKHMFVSDSIDKTLWNLACDIAVEHSLSNLKIPDVYDGNSFYKENFYDYLKRKSVSITAEKIYFFLKNNKLEFFSIDELSTIFKVDDHAVWYDKNSLFLAFSKGETLVPSSESEEEQWDNISKTIALDLETYSKSIGDKAGALTQNLLEVNREKYDYTVFLNKFATLGESAELNFDEFDYSYYALGLNLYKNIPLVEPLEYKEVKKIRDFVIAIDTSESTSGKLVQILVQKTFNILRSRDSFFRKHEIHVIQCDADIQEHVILKTESDVNRYLKNFVIKGLGGTDFRRVFEVVDELIRKKSLRNLKGLIYLTDGFGTFPNKVPKYKTGFVFIKEDYECPPVPSWVMKIMLNAQEIGEMK